MMHDKKEIRSYFSYQLPATNYQYKFKQLKCDELMREAKKISALSTHIDLLKWAFKRDSLSSVALCYRQQAFQSYKFISHVTSLKPDPSCQNVNIKEMTTHARLRCENTIMKHTTIAHSSQLFILTTSKASLCQRSDIFPSSLASLVHSYQQ